MAEPDTNQLRVILEAIDDLLSSNVDAAGVIERLIAEEWGAKLNTSGNTNTLRLGGVTGTCAHSATTGLLGSWRRNAEKRLAPEQRAGIGHNSRRTETTDDRLRQLIERVERLEEEKKGINDDINDVYGEAKAVGYDVKIMRQIVRIRKMKPDDRREADMLLDTYKCALGID